MQILSLWRNCFPLRALVGPALMSVPRELTYLRYLKLILHARGRGHARSGNQPNELRAQNETEPAVQALLLLGVVILASALAGYSRDPQIVKQKYFDKGTAYVETGKYREAEIELHRAAPMLNKAFMTSSGGLAPRETGRVLDSK